LQGQSKHLDEMQPLPAMTTKVDPHRSRVARRCSWLRSVNNQCGPYASESEKAT